MLPLTRVAGKGRGPRNAATMLSSAISSEAQVPSLQRSHGLGREWAFKPVGHGNGRKESTIFSGWPNCYLASNDPYGETLHSLLSLIRAGYSRVDRFVSVVGSFVALQFLLVVRPRSIVFFDMNPCQIQWAQMLCELIAMSDSPQEFISRIFARNVRAFERRLDWDGGFGRRLTYLNQDRFMEQPVSSAWLDQTIALLSPDTRETYKNVLMPLQSGGNLGWFTARLFPCEDRRKLRTLTRTGLGPQGRLPGDGFASFLYGEGWLTNHWTYDIVKRKLASIPISWIWGIDFPIAHPSDMIKSWRPNERENVRMAENNCHDRNLVFAMDMWSSHFARPWSRKHTLDWRPSNGRLVLIQSITAAKHELVQEVVGESQLDPNPLRWQSLSDWDSSVLLPPHICQMGNHVHSGCRPLVRTRGSSPDSHPLMREPHGECKRLLQELVTPRPIPVNGMPYNPQTLQ